MNNFAGKTHYKDFFDPEEFKAFIKVREVCIKLALVSEAKPAILTIQEVQVLTDYFEDLRIMVDSAGT